MGPKTPAMLAQHLALVLLPRAGLAPLPMHLLQGKAKYRHGRLEVEENPDRLKSRQRHRYKSCREGKLTVEKKDRWERKKE